MPGCRPWVWAFMGMMLVESLAAQVLPRASPEEVGLSTDRLRRLDAVVQSYVDRGKVAGAVTLIGRRGAVVHLKAHGMSDVDDGIAMRPDAIFRIASMTKALTSVAVMMLYEEGHFLLHDPISTFLPAFARSQVLVPLDSATDRFRVDPARRAITIRHLLTHTSGLTYQFAGEFATTYRDRRVARLYRDANISDGLVATPGRIADLIPKIAGQPLLHHPGEEWSYGLSTDVLGRLVEVVSGMSLAEFFHERIFTPLEMSDSYFYLPPSHVHRLASVYAPDGQGGLKELPDTAVSLPFLVYSAGYPVGDLRTYYSGGAGLSSTAMDYAQFLQMLLNGGELNGVRLLSPKTVELMITNHIGNLTMGAGRGGGFGLGFAVAPEAGDVGEVGSARTFSWGGFFNTAFWVDPQEDMIMIVMTQLFPNTHVDLRAKFPILVYQSIID